MVDLLCLEKQGRPGHVRGFVSVNRFTDEPKLCPVAALTEYSLRVSVYNLLYTKFIFWIFRLISCSLTVSLYLSPTGSHMLLSVQRPYLVGL